MPVVQTDARRTADGESTRVETGACRRLQAKELLGRANDLCRGGPLDTQFGTLDMIDEADEAGHISSGWHVRQRMKLSAARKRTPGSNARLSAPRIL